MRFQMGDSVAKKGEEDDDDEDDRDNEEEEEEEQEEEEEEEKAAERKEQLRIWTVSQYIQKRLSSRTRREARPEPATIPIQPPRAFCFVR